MFEAKLNFEGIRNKYVLYAKKYLHNQRETEGLLKKAIQKAITNRGTLGEAWEKLDLLVDLIKSYTKGHYRNMSPSTILTVIGTLIYFVAPLDIVPDFLIGMGILDDAAVIGYTVKKVSDELEKFKAWQKTQPIDTVSPFE